MGDSYYEIITPTPIKEGDKIASMTSKRTGEVSYRERISMHIAELLAINAELNSQEIGLP